MSERAEFTQSTRQIIAGRAGYRCSFPDCGVVTVGPGAEPSQTASVGVAAHIYAASTGGPRGNSGLSDDKLKSPENGIWLCETHAKLVDTNEGEDFPPALLISYKSLHETKIAREMGDVVTPFGWVQRLELQKAPVFQCPSSLSLGKVTLVLGKNGTGKTTLFDLLAGAAEPAYLDAWLSGSWPESSLAYSVEYYGMEHHKVEVKVSDGRVEYVVDEEVLPYNPVGFRTVYLGARDRTRSNKGFLQEHADRLGVEATIVHNLVDDLGGKVDCLVKDAFLKDDRCWVVMPEEGREARPYANLSSGEKQCIALELAMVLAEYEAESHPTLLLIDGAVPAMDKALTEYYADELAKPHVGYQTLLAAVPQQHRLDWTGWEVANLDRTEQGTAIGQQRPERWRVSEGNRNY